MERSGIGIGMSPGGPTRCGEGEKGWSSREGVWGWGNVERGIYPSAYAKSACEADALKRRRRDSNPRDVAAQQFSRLPPSTTRPTLQY